MNIVGLIWLSGVVDKLSQKHGVERNEVEQVFRNAPRFRRVARGNVAGEDVYTALGQADSGRYLIVFFIYKPSDEALVISARDMTQRERRRRARP